MLVFITGASSGIGAALAREYAAQGATLALVARRNDALQTLAANLPRLTKQAAAQVIAPHRIYAADVCDNDALHDVCQACLRDLGCPDIVIACAGVSAGTLTDYHEDLAVFEKIIRTNLLAMAATFHPFMAPMKTRGSGTLVGIASVAGIRGLPGAGAYSASKAGVMTYLESLRVELRETGIKVVTIAPGFIRTPMTAHNPYAMPFLMPVERFARHAVRVIQRGQRYAVIPWPMAIIAKLLRLLPNGCYDYLLANRPHKPRISPPCE